MEPHLRLQRMAQSAIILAFGAVIMGSVGILAAWLGDGTATHIALILIFPGGLMVLVAAYMILLALRTDLDDWRLAYTRSIFALKMGAVLAILATVITAVIVRTDGSLPQILLIALVGIQGPIAMFFIALQMARALD